MYLWTRLELNNVRWRIQGSSDLGNTSRIDEFLERSKSLENLEKFLISPKLGKKLVRPIFSRAFIMSFKIYNGCPFCLFWVLATFSWDMTQFTFSSNIFKKIIFVKCLPKSAFANNCQFLIPLFPLFVFCTTTALSPQLPPPPPPPPTFRLFASPSLENNDSKLWKLERLSKAF